MTTFGVTMREVPEWVATHPDQAIPRAVKARVLHRYGGKCYLTGKKLAAGEIDYDHIKALANGGEHRESNLAPIWRKKHVEKTADDRAEQAKTQRMHDKHFGLKPRNPWNTRLRKKMNGEVVAR